jgi:hypothetical protein
MPERSQKGKQPEKQLLPNLHLRRNSKSIILAALVASGAGLYLGQREWSNRVNSAAEINRTKPLPTPEVAVGQLFEDPNCPYINYDPIKGIIMPEAGLDKPFRYQAPLIHPHGRGSEGCATFDLPDGVISPSKGRARINIYMGYMLLGQPQKIASMSIPGLNVYTDINTSSLPDVLMTTWVMQGSTPGSPGTIAATKEQIDNRTAPLSYSVSWDNFVINRVTFNDKVTNLPSEVPPVPEIES